MEDSRETYKEMKAELEKRLSETNLNQEEQQLLRTAMEFAYSAAFSARTCDMNEQHRQAEHYESGYQSILGRLK
tara:strand:- start:344 stop:565 length:222 start_codon:yes stop_codon:yes gene_type:complete